MPHPTHIPAVITKNCFRHCHMSQGGKNHPWLLSGYSRHTKQWRPQCGWACVCKTLPCLPGRTPGVACCTAPSVLASAQLLKGSECRVQFGVRTRVGLPFLKLQHIHFLNAGRVYVKADNSWTFQKTDFHANLNSRKILINGIKFWICRWLSSLASFFHYQLENTRNPLVSRPRLP